MLWHKWKVNDILMDHHDYCHHANNISEMSWWGKSFMSPMTVFVIATERKRGEENKTQKMWMNKYFKKMWCIFYYSAWWEWNKGLMESNFHDWCSSSTTGNSIKNHQHRCHKYNLIISNCQRNFKNNSTVMWKPSLKLWHDDGNENNYKELQFYDNSSGSQKRIKRTVTVIRSQRSNAIIVSRKFN